MGCGHRGDPPGFHGSWDEPLLEVRLGDVMGRPLEGGGHGVWVVARMGPLVADVGAQVVVDDHIVRPGGLHGDHCVKGFVVDDHAFQSVSGRVPGLGHHHGHDVTRVVGLAYGHRQVGRILHVLGDRPGTGQRGSPVASQLLAGVHGDHTVGGQCTGSVDRGDAGVGMGAAHAGHPEGTR